MNNGERANISIPFSRQRPSKSFDSCASFMTAIVSVIFDWSIESCDKAPRDLDYERNTEKYGRAMKLTIGCLLQLTFRSLAAIVSEKSTVFTFSYRKA